MPQPTGPRLRSVLYTPGDRPERVRKAWQDLSTNGADLALADLEDAVAPAQKSTARQAVLTELRHTPSGQRLRGVRINAWPSSAAHDDLDAVMAGHPDVIAVPKCEDPEAIEALDEHLAQLEAKHGIEEGTTRLLVILETAAGVLSARELATSSPRILAIAFGAEDLAADVGMRRSPDNREVALARGLVVLAAAAAGIAAIDMITAEAKDLERTALEAQEARGLGYSGKMCIHPVQVVAIHEAFRPSADEVAWAKRVLGATRESGIAAGGVVVVDGKMVDVPFIRQAERILRDAA